MMTAQEPAAAARVLIVDDNAATLEVMVKLLTSAGYRCTSARGGAAGYRAFSLDLPDLVITDLNMAGGDGYVLIDRIREISSAPIIVITGTNASYAREHAVDVFDNVTLLPKPFDRDDLLIKIGALLGANGIDTHPHAAPAIA